MILLKVLTKKFVKDSNYHLFTYLGSQHFNSNEELMEGVKMWLSSMVADFFDTGIQKLIP
jgi:hypothetical protein